MPIYEYRCRDCENITEELQKFSDDPLTTCEKCGGALDKLVSMNSFQLKGSGWYLTDYAKKNSGPNTSSSNATTTDSSVKTPAESPKTESKPANS